MTREELLQLVDEVRRPNAESASVEVKAARSGTPQRIYEALSALANRPGGGVILFGLDESRGFEVTGVGDAQRLQEEVSHVATADMEPALRPEFTIVDIEGKTVVAVEVTEVPHEQKPCFYKSAGLQRGAYIRVGNTNRVMTDYEVFGYVSARVQPTYDEEAVREATLDHLDQERIAQYLAGLRRARPGASYLSSSQESALRQLRVVRETDGVLRPTLAGLLTFGKFPQEFEPQLVITFLQYYGVDEGEKTPRGERFLDNRKFEGPLPDMIDAAVNIVMANVRKSSLIEGLFRRDIPEYPEEAVREAIVNAVAHRDYSPFARGSYVQVRLFADRFEVQSPGGLFGRVTEETIEHEHSTRNRVLIRLLEDLHIMENRGSGIRTMIEAMRSANLEPPRFQDRRASFWATLRSHNLLGPAAVAWLNQFSSKSLNDRQRLALVFLRQNVRITNSDYQRLNRVDSVVASRELRGLVQAGLAIQHLTRRWAYYDLVGALAPKEPHSDASGSPTDEERILQYVREHGAITNAETRSLLGQDARRVRYLLSLLQKKGLVRQEGEKRWVRYVLP